jgi:glutathione S-transferase
MSIEILGRHTSYNVQKVLWFLEELEIEYSHTQLGGKYGGTDTEEFKLKNPFLKVPVLIDAQESVCESNTILRYLAASYGELYWWLDTPIQRASVERWMDWSIDVLERAFVGVFWGYYRTPESKRDVTKIQVNKQKCEYCLTKIEQSLAESEFLVENSISLADISVGVYIYRLVEIDLGITLQSNTASWYQKLISRPGYQKWIMSDFTELKGREGY